MSIILQSSGGGSVTIAEPTTASNFTQTLPAATGTVMVSGNMPAFSAYRSGSAQSISASTWTKVQCQTEEFDTNNNYDNSSNYRFTPTVAGYYQVTWAGQLNVGGDYLLSLYKNGTSFRAGNVFSSTPLGNLSNQSALVYCNGSTDYVEIYCYSTGTGGIVADSTTTYFQASMVRSA